MEYVMLDTKAKADILGAHLRTLEADHFAHLFFLREAEVLGNVEAHSRSEEALDRLEKRIALVTDTLTGLGVTLHHQPSAPVLPGVTPPEGVEATNEDVRVE